MHSISANTSNILAPHLDIGRALEDIDSMPVFKLSDVQHERAKGAGGFGVLVRDKSADASVMLSLDGVILYTIGDISAERAKRLFLEKVAELARCYGGAISVQEEVS